MDIKKLIILLALAIGIIVAIVIILPNGNCNKMEFHIGILGNQFVSENENQIIDKISQVFIDKGNPSEVTLFLYSSSKTAKTKIELNRKPADNDKKWEFDVKNAVKSILKDSSIINLTNQNTNEQILQFLKLISSNIEDKCKIYFLTGSFPDCYDDISANALIGNMPKAISEQSIKSEFYWCVLDVRKNEELVFKELEKRKELNVIDRRIIFSKSRECFERSIQKVYGMFFNNLSEEQSKEFINYIQNKWGKNLELTIWNDGVLNNSKVILSDNEKNSTEIKKTLSAIEKGKWHSINYLIKQSINILTQQPDTLNKMLIIVGNLPSESKGNQLILENWKQLKAIKNIEVEFYLPYGTKMNKIDNAFIEGLEDYKIINKK